MIIPWEEDGGGVKRMGGGCKSNPKRLDHAIDNILYLHEMLSGIFRDGQLKFNI